MAREYDVEVLISRRYRIKLEADNQPQAMQAAMDTILTRYDTTPFVKEIIARVVPESLEFLPIT